MSAPTVLVVGSGRSALEAAKEVVAQNGRAVLARAGQARACALRTPSGIEVLDGAELVSLEGSVGRFTARLRVDDDDVEVAAGAVIVAEEGRPCHQNCPGTTLDAVEGSKLEGVRSVTILLGPEASRPDHLAAIRLAIDIRGRSPPPQVTIFAREVMVRGTEELEYAAAQRAGARFVRIAQAPMVSSDPPKVEALDEPSGITVTILPDLLITEGWTSGQEQIDNVPIAIRGAVSMGTAASMQEGVLLCRPWERSLSEDDLMTEAKAAATRAIALARDPPDRAAVAARTDRDKCSACLTCVRTCPFHAPHIDEEGKASIAAELCQACGCCVAACPSKAISMPVDPTIPQVMP